MSQFYKFTKTINKASKNCKQNKITQWNVYLQVENGGVHFQQNPFYAWDHFHSHVHTSNLSNNNTKTKQFTTQHW